MSQLSLFHPAPSATPPRAPDVAYIRKSLHRLLRLARDAEIMPWSDADAASWEKQYPALAQLLPAEEAHELTAEFASEIARLRRSKP